MSSRTMIREIVLSQTDEGRLSAYRDKLIEWGWTDSAAIENEVGLLRLSLQRAAYDAAEGARMAAAEAAEKAELRNVQVAAGYGLDENLLRMFGIAPVVADMSPKVKISARLKDEVEESRAALAMSEAEYWQKVQSSEAIPRLHTVWGIVHHPEHGLLAVTSREFKALELPEYVPG